MNIEITFCFFTYKPVVYSTIIVGTVLFNCYDVVYMTLTIGMHMVCDSALSMEGEMWAISLLISCIV